MFSNPNQRIFFFVFVLLCLALMATEPVRAEEDTALPAAPAATKKIIAIDPGHGGADSGSKGEGGTKEKDLALSFSKMLESRLSKKFKPVLIRKNDAPVELRKRTEAANRARGDLFVSVHAGGNFSRETRGIGLFYHESRKTGEEGQGEYSVAQGGKATRRWNEVQRQYISLSRTLAMILNEHISSQEIQDQPRITVMGLPDIVLSGADMPALHIELCQLTNAAEEKRMKDKDYLSKLAAGIVSGIEAFFRQYPDKMVHEY